MHNVTILTSVTRERNKKTVRSEMKISRVRDAKRDFLPILNFKTEQRDLCGHLGSSGGLFWSISEGRRYHHLAQDQEEDLLHFARPRYSLCWKN